MKNIQKVKTEKFKIPTFKNMDIRTKILLKLVLFAFLLTATLIQLTAITQH